MERDIVIFEAVNKAPNNCPVCQHCPYIPLELRPMAYYQDATLLCVGHSVEYLALLKQRGIYTMPQLENNA